MLLPSGQFSLCLILLFGYSSSADTNIPNSKQIKLLPHFHGLNSIHTCSLDSPDLYSELIAFPSLNATLEEAKVFFGVLLDQIQSSLEGSDELTDELLETWSNLTDRLLDGLGESSERIQRIWNMLRDHYETKVLPWEARLRPTVIFEIFSGLGHEYLVLDSIVKSGVREIMNSMQGYMGNLVRRLEVKMLGEDLDQSQVNATELMQKMEATIAEEEPNFIGNLLVSMFRRAKGIANGTWHPPQPSFLDRCIEETAILIQAFKVKSGYYPKDFWRQITSIMQQTSKFKSGASPPVNQLYIVYSSSEAHLLKTLMALLSS